jgi:diaminopropionate ammonia-lyase
VGAWEFNSAARGWRCAPPPEDVRAFHASLPSYRPSPLWECPSLADELGVGRFFVKDESSRLGLPAFKILGASWAVAQLVASRASEQLPLDLASLRTAVAAQDPVTLVTATDGNHGRAVARMAALLGLEAHVFVPDVMTQPAAAAIEAEGATVTRLDLGYDAAVAHAAEYAAERATAELVQDVAWTGYERVPGWIVEGYATMLIETDEQIAALGLHRPDLVAVPVGVGSLAQAVVAHYRSRVDTATSVLGVEPDTAACVLASLDAGEPTSVPTQSTVMAGLNCGTMSSSAWPYLRDGLEGAVSVSDAEAGRAVADLRDLGIDSGPSGAATLAGLRATIGEDQAERRSQLGVRSGSIVMMLSTEGRGDAT